MSRASEISMLAIYLFVCLFVCLPGIFIYFRRFEIASPLYEYSKKNSSFVFSPLLIFFKVGAEYQANEEIIFVFPLRINK